MNGHTPGPWEWSADFKTCDGRETWSLIDDKGYGILSCDGLANSPQDLGVSGVSSARLIAAAPELLEALEYTLNCLKQTDIGAGHYQPAIAAIAKARGEA